MYRKAIATAKQSLFFRALTPSNASLLISGIARLNNAGHVTLDHQGQHLVCFPGGIIALAARLLAQEEDVKTAARLVDACVWALQCDAQQPHARDLPRRPLRGKHLRLELLPLAQRRERPRSTRLHRLG